MRRSFTLASLAIATLAVTPALGVGQGRRDPQQDGYLGNTIVFAYLA